MLNYGAPNVCWACSWAFWSSRVRKQQYFYWSSLVEKRGRHSMQNNITTVVALPICTCRAPSTPSVTGGLRNRLRTNNTLFIGQNTRRRSAREKAGASLTENMTSNSRDHIRHTLKLWLESFTNKFYVGIQAGSSKVQCGKPQALGRRASRKLIRTLQFYIMFKNQFP